MKDIMQEIFWDKEKYIFGFGDLTGLLNKRYIEFSKAISIVRRLDYEIVDEIKTGPTLRYRKHYSEINNELAELINHISKILTQRGIRNIPVKPTFEDKELDDEYLKTLRTLFSHKMAATRAGIGWIGKTDLLVTKEFGPRVRLASILVDYKDLETGIAIDKSKCGRCQKCVKECPAKASNGKLWDINTDRDEFYDAFKCREKCRELSLKNLKEEISICGICMSICPIGEIKRNPPQ